MKSCKIVKNSSQVVFYSKQTKDVLKLKFLITVGKLLSRIIGTDRICPGNVIGFSPIATLAEKKSHLHILQSLSDEEAIVSVEFRVN